MFNTDKLEQKEFLTYDQAYDYISSREYTDLVTTGNEIIIGENSVSIVGQSFPMWNSFVDALFSITKLPRKNEEILPLPNVVSDLNTVLQKNPQASYAVRLLNGKAYSIFKSSGKGIKKSLNHIEFLETLADSTDVEKVQKIVLTPKFLRVTMKDDQNKISPVQEDDYTLGIDVVNGEILKSLPVTIGVYVHNTKIDNGIVSPTKDGYVKINAAENTEILKKRMYKKLKTFNEENELTKERLARLSNTPVNQDVMRYLHSGLKCLPVESREHIFAPYFEQDVDGKMTNNVKPDFQKEDGLYGISKEILEEIARNQDIDSQMRYKAEVFVGQLLNEHNYKLNEAIRS